MLTQISQIIENAYAQAQIPCPDGSFADPTLGCVSTPASVLNPESGIVTITLKFADGLLLAVTALATITLIYGAIRYTISLGDEADISRAKKTIFWSMVGLIIGLLSKYVVSSILGILS
jgi:hypothetical protein